MTDLLQALAVNSLRGAVLILTVLILRTLLRRTPRRVICRLWSLAALRLLVPLRLTAFFGLLPGHSSAASILTKRTETVAVPAASAVRAVGAPAFEPLSALPWLWLAGTAGLLLWALIRTLRLRRRLAGAVEEENGVRTSERISTPFAFGLLRPRIYLPADLAEDCRPWVLAHEQAHIRRRDTRSKALGFFLLAVYWFNPLCWLGWFAFCRDLELACDERVTAGLSFADRKKYALALLRCSAPAGVFGAAAFGEKPIRSRIRAVLNGRSQPRWLSAGIGAVCALLILCLCFEAPAAAQSPAPAESAAAAMPTEPAVNAVPKTPPEEYTACWEFSGSLSPDGENGTYQTTVISNNPRGQYSAQASSSADGQISTITLRGVGGSRGELRIERDAEELEVPVTCSGWYTDDDGGMVYWEIQTMP